MARPARFPARYLTNGISTSQISLRNPRKLLRWRNEGRVMLSRDVRYMEVKENEDGMSAACLQAQSAFVRSIQIKKPLWIFKVA